MEPTNNFNDLVHLVKILRNKCPWDRKQTHESIKDNLIEEAYETVEAIDQGNSQSLKEEVGDLLLHVVFHSRMGSETDDFTIEDVIYTLQKKLIDRHPHVFGDVTVEDEDEVAENWEQLKMKEGRTSILDGIPKQLPALIQAQRLQEKAGSVGFDWKKTNTGKEQVWNKLMEEFNEFKEAYKSDDQEAAKAEFGDLLFTVVNMGRFLDLKAEDGLRGTNRKFENRFNYIEEHIGAKNLNDASLDKMEALWQEAKTNE